MMIIAWSRFQNVPGRVVRKQEETLKSKGEQVHTTGACSGQIETKCSCVPLLAPRHRASESHGPQIQSPPLAHGESVSTSPGKTSGAHWPSSCDKRLLQMPPFAPGAGVVVTHEWERSVGDM